MPSFFRSTRFPLVVIGIVVLVFLAIVVTNAYAWTKRTLPRDDIYYEINNDNGDHGNFIETFHVPNGRGGKVYCVVYSDQIGDGGGAGISCDWANSP